MAIDIADLSEEKFPPKFTIASEQLGELGFRRVYGIDYPYLMLGTSTGSDEEFIGKLMVHMGWRMEGLERLSESHRAALTRFDMDAFCEALIEHEPAVFGSAARTEGEDALAYVRRAGGLAVKERKGPFEKSGMLDMHESIERSLKMAGLDPSSLALSRNVGAASHLRSVLETRQPRIEMPYIPRNPVVDTNNILERVEEQIGRMVEVSEAGAALQATLNDYAQSAITEMKAGSEQTERNAKSALLVGVLGVLAGVLGTLVAVGTWLWTADQQGKAELARQEDARVAARERQEDRELMQQQLEALQRNAERLEKRLPPQRPSK